MSGLCIAAAQASSIDGEIGANLARHLVFADAATRAGVQLLVFPELSLTGYSLPRLADLALAPDDARLAPLSEHARANRITIVAGAPLAGKAGKPHIGAIVFHPDGRRSVYRKHFLYEAETEYAAPGSAISEVIDVRGVPVALAICVDACQQTHPHAAVLAGATLYAASSVVTPGGIARELAMFAGYAKLFSMGILFANHASHTGPYESAGRSSLWLPDGQLLVQAPGQGECLVIGDEDSGAVVPVDI